MSLRRKSERLLACTALMATALGSSLALATPASAADGVIGSVTFENLGGGYTPYEPFGCTSLGVTFGDSTPSTTSSYKVSLGETALTNFFSDASNGNVKITASCPAGLVDGQSYPVVVSEVDGAETPAYNFVYQQVTAPTVGTPTLNNGTYRTGVKSSVKLNAPFEVGAALKTKVVANKGATRPDAQFNAGTEIAIPSSYNAATNSIDFTVPDAANGYFIWVSVAGSKANEASNGVRLEPVKAVKVAPAVTPAYNKAWIKSVGTKRGVVKVGRTVAISAPKFSSTTTKNKTKVTYKWTVNGKTVGYRSSLKISKSLARKKLVLKVTFAAAGYKPYTASVAYGTVKR